MLGAADLPQQVKIELSSESDLFFHYTYIITDKDYAAIQESQRLMVNVLLFKPMLTATVAYNLYC